MLLDSTQLYTVRGKGAVLRSSLAADVTIENVRDVWDKVVDMSTADRVNSATEATSTLVELLDALESSKSGSPNGGDQSPDEFAFCNKDLILYALGGERYWLSIRLLFAIFVQMLPFNRLQSEPP